MKKILCLIIILMSFFTYSCKKNHYYENATIINAGLPAADGCGYLVKIDTLELSPLNLPEDFQVHNLDVKVDFQFEGNGFSCGFAGIHYATIKINKIKKR